MLDILDVIVERFNTEETKQDKQYFLNDLRKLINALEENELGEHYECTHSIFDKEEVKGNEEDGT